MHPADKPMFMQTKAGTKLLSGKLSFFQLGIDGKLYYFGDRPVLPYKSRARAGRFPE
jgi:hypothetical protein